ncbi:hypothetical protein BSY239_3295 [Hydrogenophaga sp. RAC07]|uniref:DUF4198 domain-containing protein n=1 Tax=Hydrogenophaga sp. RAC07 TaxID=1842537 RepID=UPI00083E102B|nr:DUF4198 domain-containing protein [Hydrogenophaga sp. RAC07]AOF85378.1 hypothetical protein BSY239_3295 [Hydrogenophaga sp. RAC07]
MKTWISFAALWLATAAQAHEFWMQPDRFSLPVRGEVELALRVGENFTGDPVGFGRPMAESLRWFSQSGEVALTAQLPDNLNQDSVALAFERPGAQLVVLDTRPFTITLSADTFNAYLREEGLERVMAQRQAAGQDAQPGRERYRRHVKTLLSVGGQSDASFGVRAGQTLEIVPLTDPQRLQPGGALALQVLFKGQPLQGALVKVWNQRGAQLNVLRTRTDAAGRSTTTLPWSGVWMASVVHMVPTTDNQGWDWDSHWGNLTFNMPERGLMRKAP